MSRGRLISVTNTNESRFKVGTVDKDNPKSFYVNISSWVEPMIEVEADKSLRKLYKDLERVIKNNKLTNLHILDLDLRESGLRKGKRSFMKCEITFLNNDEDLSSAEISVKVSKLQSTIHKYIFNKHDQFTFHATK